MELWIAHEVANVVCVCMCAHVHNRGSEELENPPPPPRRLQSIYIQLITF